MASHQQNIGITRNMELQRSHAPTPQTTQPQDMNVEVHEVKSFAQNMDASILSNENYLQLHRNNLQSHDSYNPSQRSTLHSRDGYGQSQGSHIQSHDNNVQSYVDNIQSHGNINQSHAANTLSRDTNNQSHCSIQSQGSNIQQHGANASHGLSSSMYPTNLQPHQAHMQSPNVNIKSQDPSQIMIPPDGNVAIQNSCSQSQTYLTSQSHDLASHQSHCIPVSSSSGVQTTTASCPVHGFH